MRIFSLEMGRGGTFAEYPYCPHTLMRVVRWRRSWFSGGRFGEFGSREGISEVGSLEANYSK